MQINLIEVNSYRKQQISNEQRQSFTKQTVLTYLGLYIITCISIIFCYNHLEEQIYIQSYRNDSDQIGWLFWESFCIVLISQFYFQFNYILRNRSFKKFANYFISIVFLIFIGPFGTGLWSMINQYFETTYIHFLQIFIVGLFFTIQICQRKQINTQNNWFSVILIPSTLDLFCQLLQQFLDKYYRDSQLEFYYPFKLVNVAITLYCTILLHMILNLQKKIEITNDQILVSACQIVGLPLLIFTYPIYFTLTNKNQLLENGINQKYLRKVILVYAFSQFVIIFGIQFPVFFILFGVQYIYNYFIVFVSYYNIAFKLSFQISLSIYLLSFPLIILLQKKVNVFFKWMLYIMYVVSHGFTLLGLVLHIQYWIYRINDNEYIKYIDVSSQIFIYLIYPSILGIVVGLLIYIAQDFKEFRFQHLFLCLTLNYAFMYINLQRIFQIQNCISPYVLLAAY